jgi:hypothetical protein
MNVHEKTPRHASSPAPAREILQGSWVTPPADLEERLRRIEILRQKIDGYIQFMGQVASQNGASLEARERAVTAFYEQMVEAERNLSRVHEVFRLQ